MFYTMSDLFAKLGLPNTPAAINAFIEKHRPLPQAEPLASATFWTADQAAFLRDARQEHTAWAEIVDELNCLLRD